MLNALFQLLLFTAKAFIIVMLILILLAGIIVLLNRGKEKFRNKVIIKNLNNKYTETTEYLLQEILPKKQFKTFLKQQKQTEKSKKEMQEKNQQKNVFLIRFNGDIKASALSALREEVTAILGIATPHDEVVVCVESGGGMVHAYGLAASQLQRFRQHNIPLTVIVDKIAASGGYMMAAVANKILAAPFAIIGSIGVIVQIPNFHRLLKEKHIDFEQLTAGNFKRTLTVFGENTKEGREKLHQEIEEIHGLFKNLIHQYRQHLDIEKVSTGEHWFGTQALELMLIDEIKTSDDYLLAKSKEANLYHVSFQTKKSLSEKLTSAVHLFKQNAFKEEPFKWVR